MNTPNPLQGLIDWAKAESKNYVRCSRCGRILTDPISISAGIGPECAEKRDAEELEGES